MKLLIPPEKAIEILQTRHREIDSYGFNPKAWKSKTENDLREIFPLGSMQWLQISQISFDTYVTSEKAKVLAEGKDTAKQLISSFIDFIKQYSKLAQEREIIKENDYQQKYVELLKEWNELVPDFNKLIKDYDEQLTKSSDLLDTIDARNTEIERIKSETIQLDNVSFSKLSKAFFNLPVWQIVAVFSIIFATVAGTFALGETYQKNEDNTETYDLKTLVNDLKSQINEKEVEIKQLKNPPSHSKK